MALESLRVIIARFVCKFQHFFYIFYTRYVKYTIPSKAKMPIFRKNTLESFFNHSKCRSPPCFLQEDFQIRLKILILQLFTFKRERNHQFKIHGFPRL